MTRRGERSIVAWTLAVDYRRGVSMAKSQACLLSALALTSACLDWDKVEQGRCGDGFVGPEETCDDRNTESGDGCSDHCQLEPAMCGNGRKEPGEQCDDHNTESGDGCSKQCKEEPLTPPPEPGCGDGKLADDEVCDDGNTDNDDACLNGCSRATCGDGFVRAHVEECDVSPGAEGTSCTAVCLACGSEPEAFFRVVNGHCFTRHDEPLNQAQARAECQDEDGDLWTVTTSPEGEAAVTRMELAGRYWLGLTVSGTTSRWLSGETFEFDNFAMGEPGAMPPACVSLLADGGDNAWHASACDAKLPFVCERSAPFVDFASNHAYMLHTRAVSAKDAQERCTHEGGALVSLESDAERAFVANRLTVRIWVNAREPSEGNYVWATGPEVDPALFRPGQPDDQDGSQACVVLEPKKRLSDEPCAELNAYLCEFE
jgi:cysteine-rich repeat protein